MKYMMMMFGSAGEMMETQPREWIKEMIAFMTQIDEDLATSGELVFQAGPRGRQHGQARSASATGQPVVPTDRSPRPRSR